MCFQPGEGLLCDCENRWIVLQHYTTAATIHHPHYYLLVYTKQSGYIIGTTTQHLENTKCDNFLFSLELIFLWKNGQKT